MVSQIAPYLTTTIVIENLANPGLGMFFYVNSVINNRSEIGARGLKKPFCPDTAFPIIPPPKIKTFA